MLTQKLVEQALSLVFCSDVAVEAGAGARTSAYVCIRLHTSAYV